VPSLAKFVQITPGPPDFSLSETPSSRTIAPGSGTTFSATVSPLNGFSGTVSFGVTGLPGGATASFSPTTVVGSGSSTLSITTSSTTATGTYPLTITATSGSLTHSVRATLVVADFTVSVTPTSQTVRRGSSTQYAVTVTALGPFTGTVNFSVTGLPQRTSSSFNPTSVAGSGTSTLIISAKRNVPTGSYTLSITGTSGNVKHSATSTLVVQ